MATTKPRAWGSGSVRKLSSGRYQARHWTPAGERINAPHTFSNKRDAEAWLTVQHAAVLTDTWKPTPTKTTRRTLAEYAPGWIEQRQLAPRTRDEYTRIYNTLLEPTLGPLPLGAIDAARLRQWVASFDGKHPVRTRAGWALLRTMLATAFEDGLISSAPPTLRGVGKTSSKRDLAPAMPGQVVALHKAMPDRYAAMVLLGAWCALRFGEIAGLRRCDIEPDGSRVRVERAVTRPTGGPQIGPPKSAAGRRTVAVPPHVAPLLVAHLANHVGERPDALLFPAADGGLLATSTFFRHWDRARIAAGRPELRFHDLRHSGAVLAAQAGATLADLMARLGHTSPAMAMRYQHAAEDRDAMLAAALSAAAVA